MKMKFISCLLFFGAHCDRFLLKFKISINASNMEHIEYSILNHGLLKGAYLPLNNAKSKLNIKQNRLNIKILTRIFFSPYICLNEVFASWEALK